MWASQLLAASHCPGLRALQFVQLQELQQTRGSMVSPRSEAPESLAVVQQGPSWLALYRTGPSTQPSLGKDPCSSHPSRNSQGHNCQGCPASQMALLCCDLFYVFIIRSYIDLAPSFQRRQFSSEQNCANSSTIYLHLKDIRLIPFGFDFLLS